MSLEISIKAYILNSKTNVYGFVSGAVTSAESV